MGCPEGTPNFRGREKDQEGEYHPSLALNQLHLTCHIYIDNKNNNLYIFPAIHMSSYCYNTHRVTIICPINV